MPDLFNRMIRQIDEGMRRSRFNVTLFRDVPEVWALYYLGLHFKMPTIVVIKKEDCLKYLDRFDHKLVKEIIEVDDFDDENLEGIAEKIAEATK